MNIAELREKIASMPDHADVVVLVTAPEDGREDCVAVDGVELANFCGATCLLILE